MSLKKLLRYKYNDTNTNKQTTLEERFVELRIQQFQLEALPNTFSDPNVEKLEELRQDSPEVPLLNLFKKMGCDKVAPRKVLITGRAGVGKSTLLEHIAREWATNQLWCHIDYLFLIKLRQLLQTEKWSITDLLFGDLSMSDSDKIAAFDEIRKHSDHVIILIDGLDEYPSYKYKRVKFPKESKVKLSAVISSIISLTFLPKAKVIVTSQPTNQISSNEFDRVVEIYGFTKAGIKQYVRRYCADKSKDLTPFILTNITDNPNIETFCHTPAQCHFVCVSMEDCFGHTDRVPHIKTMTQLYVETTYRLARALHPELKYNQDTDFDTTFTVLKDPFLKHAELAKTNCMANPLKLICYDDDLRHHGFRGVDNKTGFLARAKKMVPDSFENDRNSWSFSHLTLQQFFAALALLKDTGSSSDMAKICESRASVNKYDMVITFLAGLLGDPDRKNREYLTSLGIENASLDRCREFIRSLKTKLRKKPLKFVTLVFESQRKELIEILPEKFKTSKMCAMGMVSLCWVIEQKTCQITSIE